MSLVSVLVAIGLAGALALAIAQMMGAGFKSQARLDLDADRTTVKQLLQRRLSCTATFDPAVNPGFNPATCAATGGLARIYSNDATPVLLVSDSNTAPTHVGKWTLKALCRPNGFEIRVARPKPSAKAPLTTASLSSFFTDPLVEDSKNAVLSWNHLKSEVFPVNARPCAERFAPPAAVPPCPPDAAFCSRDYPRYKMRTGDMILMAGGALQCNPALTTSIANVYPGGPAAIPVGFNGIAACPPNHIAVGGGATCGAKSSNSAVCGGVMTINQPLTDTATREAIGWLAMCCQTTNCVSPNIGAVWVACAPKDS